MAQHSTLRYIPKRMKMYIHTKLVHKFSHQHYSKEPKSGGNPDVHQLVHGWIKVV